MGVLTEFQIRGVKDVFIFSVDELTGLPEAVNSVYPKSKIQLCIIHMFRNSLKYVSYKDRKEMAADLKQIYSSATPEEAESELSSFEEK